MPLAVWVTGAGGGGDSTGVGASGYGHGCHFIIVADGASGDNENDSGPLLFCSWWLVLCSGCRRNLLACGHCLSRA